MGSRLQHTVVAAFAAAGLALWPSAAPAQVEVAPTLGFYFPLGKWTHVSDGGTGFAPRRRQLPAHMLAARFSAWTSRRLAVEGTLAYSPSQVAVSVDRSTDDIRGRVFLASARVLFKAVTLVDGPAGRGETWEVILGAGPGLVHRGGSAWQNTSGVTEPALVLTASTRAPLAGSVMWRVGLEDFISWTEFDVGQPSQTRARLHHDLIGSLSVVVRLAAP